MREKAEILLAYLSIYLYNFNFIKNFFAFLKFYIRRYGQLADITKLKNNSF